MTFARATEVGRLRTAVTLLGSTAKETNGILVRELGRRGLAAPLVSAVDGLCRLRPGDVALARLDVLPTLDGVEPGLLAVLRLERRGVRVLNRAAALLAAHDKLRTARLLDAAALPRPRTTHISPHGEPAHVETPVVLKPRFGSWGRDVFRCENTRELERTLLAIRDRPWFRRHGVLAQELLPPSGRDLRIVVACGEVIGAATRVAAPGEWRTNVSLGGSLEPANPPPAARELACAAAAAIGADVIGVDLFPIDGGYVVLELNGAVDFDERYAFEGHDVHDDLVRRLTSALTGQIGERRAAPSTTYSRARALTARSN
jgi:[lysine-biosynthesis-protein LysW]--L-2-aminoadipate ligase